MQRFLPPVRIHSWGGLGSQLFAVALAEELKAIFPKRSLRIILHTGGVTRRLPEVVEIFRDFEYQFKEDFQPKSAVTPKISTNSKFDLRKSIISLVTSLGFLAYCNEDSSTKKLSPWVLSIRGHYSYRSIDAKFLSRLAKLCQSANDITIPDLNEACVTHYRLGDLLTIYEKNPISALAVASEYIRIKNQMHFKKLIVFSDSPVEARERFSTLFQDEMLVLDSKTSLVIANAIEAKYFIGTSSKISFWIAGIRAVVYQNISSLPLVNMKQYANLAGEDSKLISPYITHT